MITSATSWKPSYATASTTTSTTGTSGSPSGGASTEPPKGPAQPSNGTPAASGTEPPKGAAQPTTGTSKLKSAVSLGKDDFVKLLVAQLKNQDPLNPMDGKDTAAQMAQFSTVEQLMTLNQTMTKQSTTSDSLLEAISDLKKTAAEQNDAISQMIEGQMAMGTVGKTGVTDGNTVYVDRDGNGTLLVDAGNAKGAGRVTISDASGKKVGTFDLEKITGGEQAFDLARITGDAPLKPGTYSYKVEVATDGGSWQNLKTYTTGRITGLKYTNGTPILTIGDSLTIPMSKLTQVRS